MTSTSTVRQTEPDPSSSVARSFAGPDYRDRFSVTVPTGRFADVDAMAKAYLTGQPWWFPLFSMNASPSRVRRAVATSDLTVGSAIGSWEVFDRSDTEIVFGDHMGFMEYRFSLRLTPGEGNDGFDVAEGSTAVRFVWRRAGRFYFGLVRRPHRWFVRTTLARLADSIDDGSSSGGGR